MRTIGNWKFISVINRRNRIGSSLDFNHFPTSYRRRSRPDSSTNGDDGETLCGIAARAAGREFFFLGISIALSRPSPKFLEILVLS